jgi:predicted kinase
MVVVIVFGLPGSGKSYFSARLSDRLKAQYVSSDRTRIEMNLTQKYTFDDKLLVYKEMTKVAGLAIERGKDVVVDGTFYHHSMRDLFIRLARLYRVPLHFIEIIADEKIVMERLRMQRGESEADYSVYRHIKKQFDPLNSSHLRLYSDRGNINEMLSIALAYLKSEIHERQRN